MIDAEFVEKIGELAVKAAAVQEKIIEGRRYVDKAMTLIKTPRAPKIVASTLGAVVNYLVGNRDKLDLERVTVHVVNERLVEVFGPVDNADGERTHHLSAIPIAADTLGQLVGRFMPTEEFIISAMTLFRDTEGRGTLLNFVGNIVASASVTNADDGASQSVTARLGIVGRGEVPWTNPAMLAGLQSFPEIQLDERPFVLRLQAIKDSTPKVGLFEADNGAWKVAAINQIAEWFDKKLPEAVGLIY